MSKIGKKPIEVPQTVQVQFSGGSYAVQGPKGSLQVPKMKGIEITQSGTSVSFEPSQTGKQAFMNWGTQRSLLQGAIIGVTEGYVKTLEIEGIGFKASVAGSNLELKVGFSHPVLFPIPEGIAIQVEKNKIIISGIDKQKVGQTASRIRKIKKPEPYLGKGIRYEGEVVRRKAGKKAGTTK